jgi:hypothetical protein
MSADIMYTRKKSNQRAVKKPRPNPIVEKSKPEHADEKRENHYSSWLSFLPALVVFLGRRSEKRYHVSQGIERDEIEVLTLMDVGQDTTLGDGNVSEKLVQFLIVTDGELEMTRDNTGLLVVTGGIASQLQNFGSQVLENSSQVDGST